MKTCKDCIHYDVCDYFVKIRIETLSDANCSENCLFFQDKSEFIELPFSKDGYCTFGKELYRVFGVTANGDNDFYVNVYKVDKADKVFISLQSNAVTFISDEEAKKMWEELK